MKRLIPFILLLSYGTAAKADPVVPNFTQGSMTTPTETNSTVTETINSIDFRTGWEYSVTGVGVDNNGNPINPDVNSSSVTITPQTGSSGSSDGATGVLTSSFDSLDMDTAGSYTISTPGAAFQFYQTYQGPVMTNQTIIQRTTVIESVTDTTSVFTQ